MVIAMRISRSRFGDLSVLTVSGAIDDNETAALRTELLDVLETGGGDVVMDAGEVLSLSDAALGALTAARSRAKYLRHRVVLVDRPDGVVTAALCRTGLRLRFPVYADLASADEGLEADRAARRRLTLSRPAPATLSA
jgi:anti-anti-sigma factor